MRLLALLAFFGSFHAAFAASVGPAGYTNDFSAQPAAADWSTYAIPGGNTTVGTVADMDAQVQLLSASAVNLQTAADAANPPAASSTAASWCSSGFYLQTRPTGDAATILMCTLVNNIGGPAGAVTLSYDFATPVLGSGSPPEEIDGHRAYYSLTGAPGNWTPIPEFSSAPVGRLTATLNIAWPSGGTLYILWADDNSVASSPDTTMQIDNFSAKAIPSGQVPVTITSQPQNQTVQESSPASFSVQATGNPGPTFQWYKNDVSITGATNASYTLAQTLLSDNGAQFRAVAANIVSNVPYAATSSVAVLTVNADTNAPLASYDPIPGSLLPGLTAINVLFNKTVVGVDAIDLLINGVGASSVVTNDPNDYTFYFPEPPTGTVRVAWAPNNGIIDTTAQSNPFQGGSFVYTVDTNLANNARVMISEFLADNATGIRDEDGSHSDWIEVFNSGAIAASLDGWFLTDTPTNLTKWRFPSGVPALQPNSYLVIFASGKDRTNPMAPLHTNFKLAKEAGNYLALLDPYTNIVSSFNPYPFQQTDISYGRDAVDPTLLGYFTTPTPGKANSTRGAGLVPDPIFSVDSGVYTNDSLTITLSLSNAPDGTTIYYTLDAKPPTTSSLIYTDPIIINTNAIIKARAFPPAGTNLWPSSVIGRNYIFLDNTDGSFNSSLPLLIITTQGQTIPNGLAPGATRPEGTLVVIDTDRGRSSIRGKPDFIGSAGFEAFGQTSVGFTKPPIRIETHDALVNDLNASLLGMPSGNDWKLRNPYDDKTLLNDFLGYELFEKMGHYSCRRRFVEVFINAPSVLGSGYTDANRTGRLRYPDDYAGVEVLFETIGIDNDRVDIPKITPYDTNQPSITGGWILKKDKDSTGDINLTTTGGTAGTNGTFAAEALKIHEPKPNSLRTAAYQGVTTSWPGVGYTPSASNQLSYILSYLNQMEKALYATNWLATNVVGTTNHWSNYLDADSWVDFHLLVEFTKQIDGIRLSDYFHKNRGGKIEAGPVWDWNLSFGNGNYLRGGETDVWYFAEQDEGITSNEHIWLRRLINGNANMGTGNALGPGGDPDFNQKIVDRWSVLRTNVLNATNVLHRIDELSTLLNEPAQRDLWGKYRGAIVGVYQWPNPDGANNGSQASSIYVNGTRVNRTWDVDYQHPVNYLGTNTTSIIFQMKKWILGRYLWMDSQFTRPPEIIASDGTGPLIGDSMVTNGFTMTLTAPPGAALYYTLDGTDPRRPGGGIASGVYSNAPGLAGTATNLIINGNVRIFARSKAPTNLWFNSWSGPSTISLFTVIPSLRITEIMYHPLPPPPGSPYSAADFEFIEVKNIGNSDLNVGRFSLSGGVQFQFPNTVLTSGQSAVVVANIAAFQSRYGSSLFILGAFTGHLNNGGDHLVLSGGLGEPVQDFSYQDDWYPATDGLGFSLVAANENALNADWNSALSWRPSSTLSGSPGVTDPIPPARPAVVINEALTHEADPTDGDAIELYNTTGAAADVSGWFLSDDFNTPKKYVMPANTIIPANGFLVLYATNSFGATNLSTRFGLDAQGEQVYLFSGDGVNLTGYAQGFSFGAAPAGVTFGRYVLSTREEHFVAQQSATLGAANSGPLVGPIVISEISYHPPDTITNGIGFNDFLDEYIELQNISGNAVSLYDNNYSTNTWHLRNAIDFAFPTNVTVPAGGFALVVDFDPSTDPTVTAGFRTRNSVPGNVPLYGPWQGSLDNNGAGVELAQPDVPVVATNSAGLVTNVTIPYVLVDKVKYSDSAPWPVAADGFGLTLQRIVPSSYGNDPSNWVAVTASPGANYITGTPPPAITSAPGNRYAAIGSDILLNVSATGSGLRYQWRANGLNLSGATNSVLLLANFQASQAGPYQVVVYNGGGSVSANFTLTARVPLAITAPLWTNNLTSSLFMTNGGNAALSLSGTGAGFLRYQWRLNGANVPNATGPALSITNLQSSNAGTYDCVVNDDFGSTISQTASLIIAIRPVYTVQPLSQSALAGGSVTFSAALAGTTPMSFRWRHGASFIFTNAFVVSSSNYSALTVTNLVAGETYTVIVTNIAGGALGGQSSLGISSNAVLTLLADTDKDGLPDSFQTDHPGVIGTGDDDNDGMSNRDEYYAGTDPFDFNSKLQVDPLGDLKSGTVQFNAMSNRTYTVQYTDQYTPGSPTVWKKLGDVLARSTNRVETVVDPNPRTNRFYRIVIPVQP